MMASTTGFCTHSAHISSMWLFEALNARLQLVDLADEFLHDDAVAGEWQSQARADSACGLRSSGSCRCSRIRGGAASPAGGFWPGAGRPWHPPGRGTGRGWPRRSHPGMCTAVSSPARNRRTSLMASRLSVLTWSPALVGIREGATTVHRTFRRTSILAIHMPQPPAS